MAAIEFKVNRVVTETADVTIEISGVYGLYNFSRVAETIGELLNELVEEDPSIFDWDEKQSEVQVSFTFPGQR